MANINKSEKKPMTNFMVITKVTILQLFIPGPHCTKKLLPWSFFPPGKASRFSRVPQLTGLCDRSTRSLLNL